MGKRIKLFVVLCPPVTQVPVLRHSMYTTAQVPKKQSSRALNLFVSGLFVSNLFLKWLSAVLAEDGYKAANLLPPRENVIT